MKKLLIVLSFVAPLLLLGVFPRGAEALTITPPRLEISGDPGTTLTEKMTVINDQPAAATFYSSYSNFEAEGDSGTPELVPATDDLGTWMTAPASIALIPGASEDVTVTIAIPKNATPGGHFAAIFWGTQPVTNNPSDNVGIGAKTGMLVLLTVNGNISESGGVTGFDTAGSQHSFEALPVPFYYTFQNGGGDRIEPTGNIVMKDTIGITGATIPGNPVQGNILPDSTRKFTTAWTGKAGADGVVPEGFFAAANYELHNFAFGRYTAHLDLSYGTKGETTNSTVHFYVWPWQLILLILIILAIIFFVTRYIVLHGEHWVVGKAQKELAKNEEAEVEKRVEEKMKELEKEKAVPK